MDLLWLVRHPLRSMELYSCVIECYYEAAKKGISLQELVLMPELDEWTFVNDEGTKPGPSMVCDVFVTRVRLHPPHSCLSLLADSVA